VFTRQELSSRTYWPTWHLLREPPDETKQFPYPNYLWAYADRKEFDGMAVVSKAREHFVMHCYDRMESGKIVGQE